MLRRREVCCLPDEATDLRVAFDAALLPRTRDFREVEGRGETWFPTTEEDQFFLDFRAEREDRDELRFVGIHPSLYTETR